MFFGDLLAFIALITLRYGFQNGKKPEESPISTGPK